MSLKLAAFLMLVVSIRLAWNAIEKMKMMMTF
jgi:hypothetical protein